MRQLRRFSLVGILNTCVGYFVIFLVQHITGRPVLANVSGYAAGLVFSFVLYRVYVFEANGEKAHPLKFAGAFAAAYLVNLFVLTRMLSLLPDMPYLAQVTASAAYLSVMFSASKFWVFRQSNRLTQKTLRN
ncbi:GtrA family protein [Rhizobium sp. L1K21]|uniref:GtrA family protein n=1 Tax=Rhizobium sp. L1K21 TaxID=2954933 RepID=UPI002093C4AC|nr:GtrA family protein [Rhizobium sp. L1K21]MCO6187963.1 GtrA family protein [Rhizobium sp. L1K21]